MTGKKKSARDLKFDYEAVYVSSEGAKSIEQAMKPLCSCLLIIMFVSFAFNLMGQTTDIDDPPENRLNKPGLTVEEKLGIYDDLVWHYMDINGDIAIKYALEGIDLARKEGNKESLGLLYRGIGGVYVYKNANDSASYYYDMSMDIALETNNRELEALVFSAYAVLYTQSLQYEQAIENYQKSLKLCKELGLEDRIFKIFYNMANLYYSLGDFEQAISTYLRVKGEAEKIGNKQIWALAAKSLGMIYVLQQRYEEAMPLTMKALEIFREQQNVRQECATLHTLGSIYMYQQKDFEKAQEIFEEMRRLAEETGFVSEIGEAEKMLGDVFKEKGDYEQSLHHLLNAFSVIDSTDLIQKKQLSRRILALNIQIENKAAALEYLEMYDSLHQAAIKYEAEVALTDMRIKYESEKIEEHNMVLLKERRLIIGLGVSFGIIFLLVLLSMINRHRLSVYRRNLAEKRIKELEQERDLAVIQAAMESEVAERIRISQDLHDGVGGLLTGLKYTMNDIMGSVILSDNDIKSFDKALGMLDNSISELRRVSHNMMPELLNRHGLVRAMTDFCESIESVSFRFFGTPVRVDSKIEIVIYRSAQELINNALKHACATNIIVHLFIEPDRIALSVEDNGKGFDPNIEPTGIGLSNIRSRVSLFKGKIDLNSQPDIGTEVMIEISL